MKYKDLRCFIDELEQLGELKRITQTVDPKLEITETTLSQKHSALSGLKHGGSQIP